MNQFDAALFFYSTQTPLILAEKRNEWACDPYAWSELIRLTPIEESLWAAIRDANAVFYPQYPVGRFFVDFANPVAKVAIECDGKAYHMDKEKDRRRDEALNALGWKVYRITGADCHSDFNDETREIGYARKFIDVVAHRHGLKRANSPEQKTFNDGLIRYLNFVLDVNKETA